MADVVKTSLPPHSNFLDIPEEICELIFKDKALGHIEINNISRTCRYFQHICSSNDLWKQKLQQRYPYLYGHFCGNGQKCWLTIYKQRVNYGVCIWKLVSILSPQNYHKKDMSKDAFSPFENLAHNSEQGIILVMDTLMDMIHLGKVHENLTLKYYAEKVLIHMHQKWLTQKWLEYFQQPESEQTLEIGAVLIAQWCQPTNRVFLNDALTQLDDIANMVKKEIGQRSPHHPVCALKQLSEDINENLWSPQQGKVVLEALNHVLFDELSFRGNEEDYYNLHNSYINKVLAAKKGIPITLSIIYMSIARRLGVLCEPVNFPSHFLLRWLSRPLASSEQQYIFIDVYRKGKFYQQRECCQAVGVPSDIGQDNFNNTTSKLVLKRMARNLVSVGRHQSEHGDGLQYLRNALNLFLVIDADDLEMRLLQIRINLHLNIDIPEVIDSLQRVVDIDPGRMGLVAYLQQEAEMQLSHMEEAEILDLTAKEKTRKKRKVQFSVGMIMKHKIYNYTCVVYGWDELCQASKEWITQMGVNDLPLKHKQPFYNVLVEDGSKRYAAQENLLYTEVTCEITHPEVGRYFRGYTGTYYIANDETKQKYPDDGPETETLVKENFRIVMDLIRKNTCEGDST